MLLSEKSDKNQDNKFVMMFQNIFYTSIELLNKPWKTIFKNTIYYESCPIFSFVIIIVYFTLLSKYLISTVEVFITQIQFSHTFVGLTFASWGGNISGKKKKIKKNNIFLIRFGLYNYFSKKFKD